MVPYSGLWYSAYRHRGKIRTSLTIYHAAHFNKTWPRNASSWLGVREKFFFLGAGGGSTILICVLFNVVATQTGHINTHTHKCMCADVHVRAFVVCFVMLYTRGI